MCRDVAARACSNHSKRSTTTLYAIYKSAKHEGWTTGIDHRLTCADEVSGNHSPKRIYADRGYDHDPDVYRDRVRSLQITPVIARRSTEHGSGPGVHRWVVKGMIALLHWFRRLRIRWERRDDIRQAFGHTRLRHHLLATLEDLIPVLALTGWQASEATVSAACYRAAQPPGPGVQAPPLRGA